MISDLIIQSVIESLPLCLQLKRQKKHVSLVIHKRQVISVGFNNFKTHPLAKEYGYRFDEMHSELDAFRKTPKQLLNKKLTLVNVRFNKKGQLRMSKPCCTCETWCKEIFHAIYYTTDIGVQQLEM